MSAERAPLTLVPEESTSIWQQSFPRDRSAVREGLTLYWSGIFATCDARYTPPVFFSVKC